MIILGIDPGYAIVGYGIVRAECGRYQPVDYGAITTPAGMEFGRRLELIYEETRLLFSRFHPQALSLERLYFQTNKTTAIGVAEATASTPARLPNAGVANVFIMLAQDSARIARAARAGLIKF